MRVNGSFFIVFFGACSLYVGDLMADTLRLGQGTMAIGGKIATPFELDFRGDTKWKVDFEPTFDYFISSRFSVGGGLNFAYTPVDTQASERGPFVWGFRAGFKYYLPITERLLVFTGFGVDLAQNDLALVSVRWGFEVPFGLLFALNENVGVVFSVPVRVQCRSITFFNKLVVNPGYFGVLAIF